MMADKKSGVLIAFEGISGAGKGTQIRRLEHFLSSRKVEYVTTHWNSDPSVSPLIAQWKSQQCLSPLLWSTSHAVDMLKRYIEVIEPALSSGMVVIADRYVPTALSRDLCRGVPEYYVRNLYSYVSKPDILFYMDVDINTAYQRRISRYPNMGHYSSGQDFLNVDNIEMSWKKYSALQQKIYNSVQDEFNFVFIDANKSVDTVWGTIREKLRNILEIE